MDIIAVFETVGVGSIPTGPASTKIYACRSTERILRYERRDGGSIPSGRTTDLCLVSLMVELRFYTADTAVRFCHEVPNKCQISIDT